MTRWLGLLMVLVTTGASGETQTWERLMAHSAELRQAGRLAAAHQRYADAAVAAAALTVAPALYSSVTMIAIGSLLREEGRTADAERVWLTELARLESNPLKTLGTVLLHLGELYLSQHRYRQAESMLLRCAAASNDSADNSHFAAVLSSLGSLYLLQSRFEQAAGPLERALSLLEARGDQTLDTAVVALTLAKVYSRLGRTGNADALFDRSLAVAARICGGDHRRLAVPMQAFAKHLHNTGRKQRAKEIRKAAALLDITFNPADNLIDISSLRGEAASRRHSSGQPSGRLTPRTDCR